MTAHTAPHKFADTQGDLGYSYVFAEQQIRQQLVEKLSVLPMMPLVGDLVGSGTDTLRITEFGGVGWAESMTTALTEDAAIVPTGFTTDFSLISIGRHTLGKSETYQAGMLGREREIKLDALKQRVPASVQKKMRELFMATGATFADSVGTTGTAWTYDDELALVTYFSEHVGYGGERILSVRHSEQFTDLRAAFRAETGLQFPEPHNERQGPGMAGYIGTHLNIDYIQSNDVTQSGGDHQGFAMLPGAIGWARASTLPIQPEDPDRAIVVPEVGLIIEEKTDGGQTATRAWFANAWFGTGRANATVIPQVRLVSIDD